MPKLFAWSDLRYAVRLLLKTPVFTLMTVVVLAGGVAVSTFTYSFLRTAMVAPLPFDQGDQIVRVLGAGPDGRFGSLDAITFARIRPALSTLVDVGVFNERNGTLGRGREVRPISVTETEPSLFALTRVAPAYGRVIGTADMAPGAEPVLVLGHSLWRVAFGGDLSVVGQTTFLRGVSTRIIGIMPPGFGFPVAAEAWAPIDRAVVDETLAGNDPVGAFARLAPGVTREQAAAELSVLLSRVQADHPPRPGEELGASQILLRSFPLAQFGNEGPMLLVVLNGLAGLILLLACINVGNLLLARASERHREMALRQALGAPRARLIMQNLWETVILCGLGGALAIALVAGGLGLIDGWSQANLQGNLAFWWRWSLEPSAVLAAAAFAAGAIVLLGGVVSLRATSEQFHETLRDSSPQSGDRGSGRLARLLVVTQVVVVSVVMFAGGLAAIVGQRIVDVDFGFDVTRLVSTNIELPAAQFPDRTRLASAQRVLADHLAQQPGVEDVVLRASLADLADAEAAFEVSGGTTVPAEAPRAYVQAVLRPLSVVGVTLLEGRYLDDSDGPASAPVAMVSRAVAVSEWGSASPIGRQVRFTALEGPDAPWRTVVGVGGDVLLGNPLSRDRSARAVYLPLSQVGARAINIAVRHAGSESSARVAVLESVAALDPDLVAGPVQSFDEILAKSALMATATAKMFGGCFLFALLLTVSGTYGLMARSVARRTRELGVRRALGATDGAVVRMLLWQGSRQLAVGALIALPLTVLAGVGFSRVFPLGAGVAVTAAVVVSAVVAATVLLATWVPTRQAIKVEVRDALWQEG